MVFNISQKKRRVKTAGIRELAVTFILIFVFFFNTGVVYSQTQEELEYRLKAVYILNFLQFVEWPDSVFENKQSPIVLSILGDDPFGNILDETVKSEKINEHPIVVKRFQSLGELSSCHVLFISSSEKQNLATILNHIRDSSILTISDVEGFGKYGCNINFYLEENKLRFEINMRALEQADLKVSSKLLRLAKIINPI